MESIAVWIDSLVIDLTSSIISLDNIGCEIDGRKRSRTKPSRKRLNP